MIKQPLLGLAAAWLAAFSMAHAEPIAARIAADKFDIPPPDVTGRPRQLWATWYHVYPANEEPDGVALLDMKGNRISAAISQRAFCLGAIEGTIYLSYKNGTARTFNYAGTAAPAQVDCSGYVRSKAPWVAAIGRSRFAAAKGPYGDGVMNFVLVPLRTIAVDKASIPFGSVLYIPAARGAVVRAPSGKELVHDGYFFAADTGGAIKGAHIDIFAGALLQNPFPVFVESSAAKPFDAYVIDNPQVRARLRSLHEF